MVFTCSRQVKKMRKKPTTVRSCVSLSKHYIQNSHHKFWENCIFKFMVGLLLLAGTCVAKAEDLSSCTLKTKADEMNYCKASFAGSATFCDMIKNGGVKRDCYFMVIRIQRNNAYQLKKPEAKAPEKE